MIIRATKKVLNLNRIKPAKNDSELLDKLPGEWYVDLISLGKPGKFGLQFLHHPTKIAILIPGRSLKKVFVEFKDHVTNFLNRNGYDLLIDKFQLDDELNIYPTNDRGMLALMNQIKWNSEYHCVASKDPNVINYEWIEDIYLNYLFTTKKTGKIYLRPQIILDGLLNEYNNELKKASSE